MPVIINSNSEFPCRSKKTKGVSYYLVHWKGYNSEDDTWEPEENLLDCKEAFEEFLSKEKIKEQKQAKKEQLAGQKRRRLNEQKKLTRAFLSSDDSDNSPSKSPPQKKQTEKRQAEKKQVKSIVDYGDGKSSIKKEKKAPKPKPEIKKESRPEVKREPKSETKRVYKFLSDEDDDLGLSNKASKPDKKKIPKISKPMKSSPPPRKSEALEDAARFFEAVPSNTEFVRMKREKKKKKREKAPSFDSPVAVPVSLSNSYILNLNLMLQFL